MPNVLKQKGQFEPVHAAHAIEQVVLVLQFDQPLGDAVFAQACEAAEQFNQELPARGSIRGVSFTFSPGAPNPGELNSGELNQPVLNNGIVLSRIAPDGTVSHELRVERATLVFKTTLYSRWDTVWLQANRYFNELVPIYAGQAGLAGVSINCVDKFVWTGNLAECNPSLLLRANSKYLCPHVYDAEDFWHSHTGAFTRVDASTKRLINVNVDYLDEKLQAGSRRIIAITTVLTDLLNQPGYEANAIAQADVISFIGAHMQGLHILGKEILGDIINDPMGRRIALIE